VKFNPNAAVWAKVIPISGAHRRAGIPCGEVPAVIKAFAYNDPKYDIIYDVALLDWPDAWEWDEKNLRPRRDDYQQHEGLGSMDKIGQPLTWAEALRIAAKTNLVTGEEQEV
jgi:hypothetical protein